MTVQAVQTTNFGSFVQHEVKLNCAYDMSIPEDQRFKLATPCGTMSMHIDNPVALEQFKPGSTFYLDFTPCPKA